MYLSNSCELIITLLQCRIYICIAGFSYTLANVKSLFTSFFKSSRVSSLAFFELHLQTKFPLFFMLLLDCFLSMNLSLCNCSSLLLSSSSFLLTHCQPFFFLCCPAFQEHIILKPLLAFYSRRKKDEPM